MYFSTEMESSMKRIVEYQQHKIRECKTFLAGFSSTEEQDLEYMDSYMDGLLDFMDPESEVESLYREYLAHIESFNPKEARERIDILEDDLGYKNLVVYASAILARELHNGQKDKGYQDYFAGHLMHVGQAGFNWKEKVTGFLHDAAEDTGIDIPTIISRLKAKLKELNAHPDEIDCTAEFDFCYPLEYFHSPSGEEWKEIADALYLLNKNKASSREEYISRIKGNQLALHVKLNDLRNKMDLSFIPDPTDKVLARQERYKKEYGSLLEALPHPAFPVND